MGDAIEAHGVTVWSSVVSALRLLLERGGLEERALDTVRLVAFSGERMPFELLRQIAARLPWARLYNVYGQTEANSSTVYEVTERDLARAGHETLPIGDSLQNFEVFALDDAGHELTRGGDIGELYVRSASVAAGGYLRDPELSAARFVVDPRHPESGARAYRTGDRVERGEHGELYLRGRADGLVKVRGHRVDLGEVEVALESLPGLAEVAALAVPDEGAGHRLAAFVRPRDGVTVTRHEIAAHLALRLPRAVLPEHIEVRAELPHTSTGKIDRAALLATLVAPPAREAEARP